jgi:hypothetical protein
MRGLQLGALVEINESMEGHERKISGLQADIERRLGWLTELTMDELGMEEWPRELPQKKKRRKRRAKKKAKKKKAKRASNPGDEAMRRLERRFAESGSHEDGVALNKALRRAGLPALYRRPRHRKFAAPEWVGYQARTELKDLAARYSEHERPDSGLPEHAVPGALYASSSGKLRATGRDHERAYGGFMIQFLATLQVGTSFGDHDLFSQVIEEAIDVLLPYVEDYGGSIHVTPGTNFARVAWRI